MPCKICGSHAINPGHNGRGEDRLDLCDVCYWRERCAEVVEAVRWEHECLDAWLYARFSCGYHAEMETNELWMLARAAVDALIGGERNEKTKHGI